MPAAACVVALIATHVSAQVDFLADINVDDTNNIVPDGLYDTETVYVPSVTFHENGLASFEALKAQAVAARTFAYFKMQTSGSIDNGQNDQVFVRRGSSIVNSGIWRDAALDTWGEVLTHPLLPEGETIASFYVAGGLISPFTPIDSLQSGVTSDPTNTERFVTYNLGDTGSNIDQTSLGFETPNPNDFPVNRGAKSQNGADFLSDNSVSYIDILKHYYGADIQLETAISSGGPASIRPVKFFADFDDFGDSRGNVFAGHESTFGRSPTVSGSTSASLAGSTAERSSDFAFSGGHSQKLDIDFDESSGDDEWLLRHLSSAGGPFDVVGSGLASGSENLLFEAVGSVGFWMLTETEGLEVSVALDDPGTSDRGKRFEVIADGDWHKYEWFIEEESFWEPWLAGSNGEIDGLQVSLDSIQLFGSTDATVYLDSIFWDSQAIIPEPTTLALFASLGGWGLLRRRSARPWRGGCRRCR